MTASVCDDLEQNLGSIGLLGCIHGLNERDRAVFQALQGVTEGVTVDDVADRPGCERLTAYRSTSRLVDAGVVVRRQGNYEQSGYCYVHRSRTLEEAAREIQRLLNSWCATVGQLIPEFEDRYGDEADGRGDRSLRPGP